VYGESRMHGSEGREGAISKTFSFTRQNGLTAELDRNAIFRKI
jgi:hypothetical protein